MKKNKLNNWSENSLKSNRGKMPPPPTSKITPPQPPKNISTQSPKNISTQPPKNISTQPPKNVPTGQKTVKISDHMIENPLNKAEQKEINKIDERLNKVKQKEINKIDEEINKATGQLNNSLNKVNLGRSKTPNRRRRKKRSNKTTSLISYLNIVTPIYKKYKNYNLYISNRLKFNEKVLELENLDVNNINIELENLVGKRDTLFDLFNKIDKTYLPKELNDFEYKNIDDVIQKFNAENLESEIKSIIGAMKLELELKDFLKDFKEEPQKITQNIKDFFKISWDDILPNKTNVVELNNLDLEDFNFNNNYPSLNVKDSDINNDKKLKEFNDIINQENILTKLEYTLNTYNIVKKKFDLLGDSPINKKNLLYDENLQSQMVDLNKIQDDLVSKLKINGKINGKIDSEKIKKLKDDIIKEKQIYLGKNKDNNNIKKLNLKSILINDANMKLRIEKLSDRKQILYIDTINLKIETKYNIPLKIISNIMTIIIEKILQLFIIFMVGSGIYLGMQNYVFRRGISFSDNEFDKCMKDNFNSNEKCLKICEEEEEKKACETDCLVQKKGLKTKYNKYDFNYDTCIDDCKNHKDESFDYIQNITTEIKESEHSHYENKQLCIIKNNEKTKELEKLISSDNVETFTQKYKENINFEILIYEKVLDKILNLNQDQLTETIITKLIKDEIILFFREKLSNNQNLNIKKIKNIVGFYPDYYQCPKNYLKYFNIDEKDYLEIYFLRKIYEILDDSEKEKFLYFNDNSKKQFLIEKYNYMIFNQKYKEIIEIQNNNNKIINILIVITIIITLLFIFLFTK
jgi:hypothetical protein